MYEDINGFYPSLEPWWPRISELRQAIDRLPSEAVVFQVASFSTEVAQALRIMPGLPPELREIAALFEGLIAEKARKEYKLSR